MLIKTLTVGHLDENCYIVTNEATLECVCIDPGDESNTIMDYLEDNRLVCKAIMLTHGHFDHVGAVLSVMEETGATVYMSMKDDMRVTKAPQLTFALPEGGKYFEDGQIIEAAGLKFFILATPGHTPGSVTIICEDAMFTGDTLFRGSCGRTDLPGGDPREELFSLRKLCMLEGDFEVYPGHLESTTLERERAYNHYCRMVMNDK